MKPQKRSTRTALTTAAFATGLIVPLMPAALGAPQLPPITATTTQITPVQVPPPASVNLPLPSMQPVGAPNMFTQDGRMNTQQNSNLPNAFNWHPYMPGVPANTGTTTEPPPPSYQILPPSNLVIQTGPSYGYGYGYGYSNYGYGGGNGYPYGSWQDNGAYSNNASRPIGPARPQPTQTIQPSRPVGPITGTVTTIQPVQTNPEPERHRRHWPDYGTSTITVLGDDGTPTIIGGYYYPSYCDESSGPYIYPSIYSGYSGFPGYIYSPSPGITVLSDPEYPQYSTSYVPFQAPTYQVNYNQYNYYASTPEAAEDIENGGRSAQEAVKSAYGEDTYQAAFADIEQAWMTGNIELIRKHLRDDDTKIGVLIDRKYSYSISSADYAQITRDAMKTLDTVSFKFTRLRKAKNGDVTAYGMHIYTPASTADNGPDDTVAFDTQSANNDNASSDSTSADASSTDNDNGESDNAAGRKVMFVSYTLRKGDGQWNIVLVDSSKNKLVPSQSDTSGQL